jgi:hypothetical protein
MNCYHITINRLELGASVGLALAALYVTAQLRDDWPPRRRPAAAQKRRLQHEQGRYMKQKIQVQGKIIIRA